MEEQRFDELTKALTKPTSRRQVLKVLVPTTIGGFFVRSGGGTAWAGGCTPNKNCAKFCASVFGDNTPAAEQCASDAAKCKGLCQSCGAANASTVCCPRNRSGFCTSCSSAACCSSTQVCSTGKCCASGQTNCGNL